MRGFRQQGQNMLKVFGYRIFTVFILLILFFLIRGGWDVYQKYRETYINKVNSEAKLNELIDRKHQLQAEVLTLKSNRGLEEEIRQQFEVAREGEGLIIIVDRPVVDNDEDKQNLRSWWRPLWPW
jgi:cell division protein FtsB